MKSDDTFHLKNINEEKYKSFQVFDAAQATERASDNGPYPALDLWA